MLRAWQITKGVRSLCGGIGTSDLNFRLQTSDTTGRRRIPIECYFTTPTSVAAMMFDADGTELAIASSHTFETGERERPKS
eukprot:scaffold6748_cov168-Chaetoceros_neogracile.AAC.1